MLGLRRLKLDAIWLELLPATNDLRADRARIDNFQRQLRAHGLAGRYCLLYQNPHPTRTISQAMRCIGMSKRSSARSARRDQTRCSISSYSIHPPFLLQFERRIFCDLDPERDLLLDDEDGDGPVVSRRILDDRAQRSRARLPAAEIVASLEDILSTGGHASFFSASRVRRCPRFTTIGQWYWGGAVEVDGAFPDLSKKFAFEPYLDLPKRIPEARFELAMNIKADDPERARLATARLARCRSASRCAHARRFIADTWLARRRIHRDQRRGRGYGGPDG